jgi:hypothetical protein
MANSKVVVLGASGDVWSSMDILQLIGEAFSFFAFEIQRTRDELVWVGLATPLPFCKKRIPRVSPALLRWLAVKSG